MAPFSVWLVPAYRRTVKPEIFQQGPVPGSAVLDVHQGVPAAGVEDEAGGLRAGVPYGGDADAAIAQDI
jgi:hypothetical protein